MNDLPLLSTGQQEFSTLRQTGRIYVDKTAFIFRLLTHSSYFFFLSRPRRFGKSLLINTLKELFLGKKELFEGLYIYDKIQWQTYPVIYIDCSKLGFRKLGLESALHLRLQDVAKEYGIELVSQDIGLQFAELMKKLYEKTQKQVVVLVDEYDKPITDVLEQSEKVEAHQNREILRRFYSVVKGSSAYIRFFFLTGITRFTKVSLFSDLNNLVDISFDDAFHNFLGYTQEELENYFQKHLAFIAEKQQLSLPQLLEKIKYWYNGYSWNGIDRLYNPFSILRFLDSGKFMNYWFESGTPKMLVELLKKEWLYDLRNIKANMSLINNFDIDNLNAETLLFQTGYLTIDSIDEFGDYVLNYPNYEVELSMTQHLIGAYTYQMRHASTANQIATAIRKNNLPLFIETINILFADIPAEIFLAHKEAYYHSVVFLALRLAGFHVQAEVRTSKGRIDAVLSYENRIYLFEFKLDENPHLALEQIQQKEYFKKYLHTNNEIYLVGINFSST
ncbi:MAG: AAA family ATPase, partial [Bacteroidia bacterium]|nr:AAA family ATPase [Bacteroidia bacterium]